MKNFISKIVSASIFFVLLFSANSSVFSQTAKRISMPIKVNNIDVVSTRIASIYGADEQTVRSFVQAAVSFEGRTQISATAVIAIAIHESSFTSLLFEQAGNPFGIKASKPWTGETFSKFHDGEETKFRKYHSPEAAVEDFGRFIKSRNWYADARSCQMDDYACFINGLKKTDTEPGYSMDPNWDEAIIGIIQRLGLESLSSR